MNPLVIIDPALGRTGAHNHGFADLLIQQGADAGDLGVWCHASIGQPLRDRLKASGVVVRPAFSAEFYQVIAKDGGIADHWSWVQALATQYLHAMEQILDQWPRGAVRAIHHTLSWEHANALSLALRLLGARGDRLDHLVFLMYSPGLDEAGQVFDAGRRLNYRLAFQSLDAQPNVRLYASCGEYACAYAALLERPAPLPVHPCFIGDWRVPPPHRNAASAGHERVLLYVGEIKQEKGFLELPETLESLLRSAPTTRRFVIQFVSVRNNASRNVLSALERIAASHSNVELHHGFWPDEELHRQLAACDMFHLGYDSVAYAHKSSGLLWLAAWYNVPVVVPRDSWLHREALRLGLGILPDALAVAADARIDRQTVDEAYRRTLFTPFWQWLQRQGRRTDRHTGSETPHVPQASPGKGAAADVVVFWKQNDSTLYGRRVDMVVRYLASRPDVRRVLVIDAPIGDANLAKLGQHAAATHHGRLVQSRTLAKQAGQFDAGKVAYGVFVCPLRKFRFREDDSARPRFIEGYIGFLQDIFSRQGIDPRQAVFWIYPRNFHAPTLIRKFQPGRVVVDVVDDDRAWPGVTDAAKRQLTDSLRGLLQSADMAFANCAPVQQAVREFCPGIRLVPNGCDRDPPQVAPRDPAFQAFCRQPGQVIGFVGNLETKIDIDLLHKVAERFSTCHIVLIGSTHANPKVLELLRHANVSLPGVVPYEELGAWLSRFDVGLIPHLATELTRHMNPLKTYVYLSRNIPVVATAIANVDTANGLVRVAESHAEFGDQVARVLAGDRPSRRAFRDFVTGNSWEARFSRHVDELALACLSSPRVIAEPAAGPPATVSRFRRLASAFKRRAH